MTLTGVTALFNNTAGFWDKKVWEQHQPSLLGDKLKRRSLSKFLSSLNRKPTSVPERTQRLRGRERPGKTSSITSDCPALTLCYQWFPSMVRATAEPKLQPRLTPGEIRLKLPPFPNSCRVNTIFSQPVRCTKFLKELLLWPFSPSSDMNHWK